jgi:hypothetical protein
MNYRIIPLIAFGVMLAAGAVDAHHNMSAIFDFNQRFTLTGALTKVDWRNPHIELFVDVKTEQGQVQTWRYEGPSPGIFRTRNIGKDNFTIGMTLKVEASRARDGSMWGLIREVTLPDGTVVSLCPQNC